MQPAFRVRDLIIAIHGILGYPCLSVWIRGSKT
jgi:hypothetical protein